MKGPSEKGGLLAVLEYVKGGQVVTHPCAPLTLTFRPTLTLTFKKLSSSSGGG